MFGNHQICFVWLEMFENVQKWWKFYFVRKGNKLSILVTCSTGDDSNEKFCTILSCKTSKQIPFTCRFIKEVNEILNNFADCAGFTSEMDTFMLLEYGRYPYSLFSSAKIFETKYDLF